MLVNAKGSWILRRKGGPAMGDRELEKWVGSKVVCSGFLVGSTLLAESIVTAARSDEKGE
jgi:hypothetical protein